MQSAADNKEYWANHIRDWKSSGLTQTAYCDRENIKVYQLSYQKSKIDGSSNKTPKAQPSKFAAVEVLSPCNEALTLTFSGGIQLSGIDAANLTVVKHLMEMLK